VKILSRLITAVAFAAVPLLANVTYVYTGNPFTTSVDSPQLPADAFISATLTLTAALGPGRNAFPPTVVSWSMTDGTTIVDSANSLNSTFLFDTDPLGNISKWTVEGSDSSPHPGTASFGAFGPGLVNYQLGNNVYTLADVSIELGGLAYNTNPGSWSMQGSSSAPEPSTFALLLLPLAWLGVRRLRLSRD
jgi:hypothetical protein